MKNINKNISPLILQRKNKNENFSGSDTENRFNENLMVMPKDWKYRTKTIEYKTNSLGYRTREFKDIDWKNSIVVLGCSMIYGIGLAEDETMCYYLEKITGRQVVNLGYAGGCNNIIVNNLAGVINNFDVPYAVIILWTSINRFVFFENNHQINNIGPWVSENRINNFIDKDKKKYITNIANKEHICTTNYLLVKQAKAICKNRIHYFDYSFFFDTASELNINLLSYVSDARDLMHPGFDTNYYVADRISKKINNLSSIQ